LAGDKDGANDDFRPDGGGVSDAWFWGCPSGDGGRTIGTKEKKIQIPSPEWDDKQVELIKLYNSIFSL